MANDDRAVLLEDEDAARVADFLDKLEGDIAVLRDEVVKRHAECVAAGLGVIQIQVNELGAEIVDTYKLIEVATRHLLDSADKIARDAELN